MIRRYICADCSARIDLRNGHTEVVDILQAKARGEDGKMRCAPCRGVDPKGELYESEVAGKAIVRAKGAPPEAAADSVVTKQVAKQKRKAGARK